MFFFFNFKIEIVTKIPFSRFLLLKKSLAKETNTMLDKLFCS